MHLLNKNFKIIARFAIGTWQINLNYPLGIILWVLNGLVTPLILLGIWLTIRRHQSLPLNESQLITYYFLAIIVQRITQTWTGESLGREIHQGYLSAYLTRPLYYLFPQLGRDIALRGIRLISLAPIILIFWMITSRHVIPSIQSSNVVLFIIAILIGYVINFLLETIIGLLALWLHHNDGAYTMFSLARELLGGSLIPLVFMPEILKQIMIYTPFRYILSFPIEIISGTITPYEISKGFLVITVWVVISKWLADYMFNQGIKKYTAVGI